MAQARGPGSVSLGRVDHAPPELALMREVVGHRIVERVVVLPDDHGIRQPGKAEMEFRPLDMAIQFTKQLIAFRCWELDNAATINRYVDEQVPPAILWIAGH